MISIYKKSNGSRNDSLVVLKKVVSGCWINVVDPTVDEINYISKKFGIDKKDINDFFDDESVPKIETDSKSKYYSITLRVPFTEENNSIITIPLGIILLKKKQYIFTFCGKKEFALSKLVDRPPRIFCTTSKIVFFNQLIRKVLNSFMKETSIIEKEIDGVENSVSSSIKNKEIVLLLSFQKTLVYFRTSLVGNKKVLTKILSGKVFPLGEEGKDFLEDSIIDLEEVQQLVNIYSEILSNTLNAYVSIISNNLNNVMKFLAVATLAISIPMMISSFYGMNINLPFQGDPFAFFFVIGFSSILMVFILGLFKKFNWI